MNRILIITNSYKDKDLAVTKEIIAFLEEKNVKCANVFTEVQPGDINIPKEFEDSDCFIVLGGDGTLIHAARVAVSKKIPLIGVNLGTVGYLCELESGDLKSSLEKLINNEFSYEKRMMLSGDVYLEEKKKFSDVELNDIVIHRGGELKLLDYIIYVNGEHLYTYSSDGIILSTPTGSTGYSMSAGGPIVEPGAELIVITPINPHSLNGKSIIISADDEVIIEIGAGRRKEVEKAQVTFDGRESVALQSGDRIKISKSENVVEIINISNISFLKTLRKKMKNYT